MVLNLRDGDLFINLPSLKPYILPNESINTYFLWRLEESDFEYNSICMINWHSFIVYQVRFAYDSVIPVRSISLRDGQVKTYNKELEFNEDVFNKTYTYMKELTYHGRENSSIALYMKSGFLGSTTAESYEIISKVIHGVLTELAGLCRSKSKKVGMMGRLLVAKLGEDSLSYMYDDRDESFSSFSEYISNEVQCNADIALLSD